MPLLELTQAEEKRIAEYAREHSFDQKLVEGGLNFALRTWDDFVRQGIDAPDLSLADYLGAIRLRRIIDLLKLLIGQTPYQQMENILPLSDEVFCQKTSYRRGCLLPILDQVAENYDPDIHWYYSRILPGREHWLGEKSSTNS